MWTASVESNRGETLLVLMSNGGIAGKGLLAFQAPLDLYCWQQVDNEEQEWFDQLNTSLNGKLCQLARPFLDSLVSGDWNYSEDEYEFFQARSKAFLVTEDLFKNGLERARKAWTSAEILLKNLKQIVTALTIAQLSETHWYKAAGTIAEFEALIETISLLISRDAQEIRVNIE